MSRLQMDDAKHLWDQMGGNKNWSSLESTLRSHKNKAGGIDDSTVDMMTKVVKELQSSNHPFPKTPQELDQVLNQHAST